MGEGKRVGPECQDIMLNIGQVMKSKKSNEKKVEKLYDLFDGQPFFLCMSQPHKCSQV